MYGPRQTIILLCHLFYIVTLLEVVPSGQGRYTMEVKIPLTEIMRTVHSSALYWVLNHTFVFPSPSRNC